MHTGFMNKFLEVRGVAAIVGSCAGGGCQLAQCCVGVASATTLTAPTISGTAQEGQTLTVNAGTPGPSGDTFTLTDQWLVCTTATTCTNGPTGASFLLAAARSREDHRGSRERERHLYDGDRSEPCHGDLRCNGGGAASASGRLDTPAVGFGHGSARPDADSGARGLDQHAHRVLRRLGACTGGTCASTGVTTPTYAVGLADVGYTIEFVETALNAGGASATSETSSPTAVVLPLPPANTALPVDLAGHAAAGPGPDRDAGAWTHLNTPTSITDQWEDCAALVCSPIPGQTGTSYTVGPGDVGHTIEVVETAFNAAAPLGVAATSARTATASTTSTTSVVAFSQNAPTTNQAVTLVATVSSSSGNANPHGTLSFFNGSDTIRDCAGKGVSGGQTITIVCQAAFPAGVAQISAAYVADPGALVAGSSSDTTPVSVGKGSTSVSLAVTPKVAPGGQATYVATLGVPVSSAGPTLPSGSIEFMDGGQPIGGCVSQALSNLTATCSVSYPAAGTHNVSAFYSGDSNFTGSASSASSVQIVAGAAKNPTVHGSLGSTLGWKIAYHPHYSELIALTAYAVPKGTSILVQCFGKGCPFAKWHLTKAGTINLLSRFRHRHLRAGVRITVRLTRRHWVGKYYSFTIRAGHAPVVRTDCLGPSGGKPGASCTSPST